MMSKGNTYKRSENLLFTMIQKNNLHKPDFKYSGQTRPAINGRYSSYFARLVATVLRPYFDVP